MSTTNTQTTPLMDVQNISKYFGSIIALKDISMRVGAGQVMCLLGDNGAGKSTLIKILSGVHQPSEGHYLFEGKEVHFTSPRDALNVGIATVFQDLVRAMNFSTRAIEGPVYFLIAERRQLREFLMRHYPVPQHIAEYSAQLA